jgi:hypothetical protein
MNKWHSVRVSRTARLVFLAVDDQSTQTQMSPGAFDELTVNQNMYLGGVPTFRLVSPYIPIRRAFKGCVQKVRVRECGPILYFLASRLSIPREGFYLRYDSGARWLHLV